MSGLRKASFYEQRDARKQAVRSAEARREARFREGGSWQDANAEFAKEMKRIETVFEGEE